MAIPKPIVYDVPNPVIPPVTQPTDKFPYFYNPTYVVRELPTHTTIKNSDAVFFIDPANAPFKATWETVRAAIGSLNVDPATTTTLGTVLITDNPAPDTLPVVATKKYVDENAVGITIRNFLI